MLKSSLAKLRKVSYSHNPRSHFVYKQVIDFALHRFIYDKTLFIISEKHEEIRISSSTTSGGGGTFLLGNFLPAYAMQDVGHHLREPDLFVFQKIVVDVDNLLVVGIPEMPLVHLDHEGVPACREGLSADGDH